MADFDAGSIEGRLDLDTSAFIRGLKEAKAQAAEFEATSSTTSTAGVNVDSGDATAKIARVEAELDRLDHKRADPKIDVDTTKGSAAILALDAAVNKAAGFYSRNSGGGFAPGGGHGMAYLLGLAASLAPALGPAVPALGLFGAAGVAAFGGMAASMGLWAAVTKGVFKQISDADKAGKTLTGSLGQLQTALHGLSGAWSELQTKAGPGIAAALIPTFTTLAQLLPKLLPLINSISTGVGAALRPIDNLLKSGQFERFIHLLGDNAVKDLPQLGHALANILSGLMGVFTALNPLIQMALPVVVGITKEFRQWSHTGATDFVHNLFDTVQTYGPLLLQLLQNVFAVIGNLAAGLAPLTGPALHFLIQLTDALAGLDLTPLTTGVGKVLTALGPFLTVIGQLVNVLLPPLGTLLGTLADSFIGPLGNSLATQLTPAFQAVADVLAVLAPVLGEFIASIADLVNPTGVGLLVSLITGLAPIVEQLIPPLGNLILALEGMVDNFLKLVGPAVIPALITGLGGIADVVGPVLNFFAWFLAHPAVGDTILGIAVAVKAVKLAMAGWAIITALLDGVAAGLVGIAVAEDASTAAIVANKVVLFAVRGAMLAWAAATSIAEGAVWLLNLALDANPIGLVIIAVAALVVGVIEAYKHVGWFRDAVNAVWDAMKVAGEWIAGVFVHIWHDLASTFTGVYDVMYSIGDWINGAFIAIWHALGDAFDFVKSHLKLFMLLLGPLGVAIDTVITVVQHWHQILGIITGAWNAVISWLRGLPGKIAGVFSGAGDWLNSHGRAIISGLWNGIKDRWSDARDWLGGIGGKILGAIGSLGTTLYSAGWSLISGFWNGIKDRFTGLLSDAGHLMGKLGGLFPHSPAEWGPFSGTGWTPYRGRALMEGFAQGIRAGAPSAEDAAGDAMGVISRALSAGVTGVVGQASVDVTVTRPGYAAELQAQAQSDALDRLTAVLKNVDPKSLTKEDQETLTDILSKAFSAASVAQAQKIITAVKQR